MALARNRRRLSACHLHHCSAVVCMMEGGGGMRLVCSVNVVRAHSAPSQHHPLRRRRRGGA
eukprot:3932309-Pleurochrysis_carterae.AAC.1